MERTYRENSQDVIPLTSRNQHSGATIRMRNSQQSEKTRADGSFANVRNLNKFAGQGHSAELLPSSGNQSIARQSFNAAVGLYAIFAMVAGTTAFKLFGLGTPAFGLFYLGGVLLVVYQFANLLSKPLSLCCVLLFPLFAMSSSIWGIDPETTLRHSIQLTFTALVGASIGCALKPHKLMLAMSVALVGLVVLSVLNLWLQLVPPFQQREYLEGNEYFTGVFAHKNTLGMVLCLTALCLVYLALSCRPAWPYALAVCALLPIFIFARSTTSLVMYAFILCMPCVLFFMRLQTWRIMIVLALLCTLLAIAIVLEALSISPIDIVLELAGKGRDLSGRTSLWATATELIVERPWFGVGYQSFWTTPHFSTEVNIIRGLIEPSIGHFHNAWLEALVGTGILGLLAFIAVPVLLLFRLVPRLIKPECSPVDVAGTFFVLLVLARGNVEASIYFQHQVENLVLIALVFATSNKDHSLAKSDDVSYSRRKPGRRNATTRVRYQ